MTLALCYALPQYRLKGVVAHVGGVDSGHYYSFIRVQDGSWLEFNDSVVTPFNEGNIPRECFGGLDPGKLAAVNL
jgi:ubiquitin carboxyl-terminal hydrolase 34